LHLSGSPGAIPSPFPRFAFRPFSRRGRLEDMTRRLYANALLARGEYYVMNFRDTLEAQKCLENAYLLDPESAAARRLGAVIRPKSP
jgi:hypothetical protein